jgi:hypothetical protein
MADHPTAIEVRNSGRSMAVDGEATAHLRDFLIHSGELPDPRTFDAVKQQSFNILRQCKTFDGRDGSRTGIVVGYVQSGKTISMTTVCALAKDNGCRLIIVLAGTTKNLMAQTKERFRKYLHAGGTHVDDWLLLDSQDHIRPDRDTLLLRNYINEWADQGLPEHIKKTMFITVLKNHTHLDRLRELLTRVDLSGVPALMIDDEADQAGLNTAPNRATPSTTHRQIGEIRTALPNHTYLQYTATPQAPLLINLADILSPEFAEVIEPGPGYAGGMAFFESGEHLVRVIPSSDLFPAGSPPNEPPASLLDALRLYFIGVTASQLADRSGARSMLIHPSQRQADHGVFVRFVESIMSRWQSELALDAADPDRTDTVREFRRAYDDLLTTAGDLPPFDEGFLRALRLYIGRTVISEVNSNDGREVDWDLAQSHVLVGGEKLNRGYTVKGLTVTYMPRDAGGWNADTLQQRARFFGYKASYLGYCRVYLHSSVKNALHDYVLHERDVREQLVTHRGRSLQDWKRAFFLDARLRPTRTNVLSDPYFRVGTRQWFVQSFPHAEQGLVDRNRRLVEEFLAGQTFEPHPRFPQHSETEIPLSDLIEFLLLDFQVIGAPDVVGLYANRVWIADLAARERQLSCTVVLIMDGASRSRTANRGRINLHEGRRANYPGDSGVRTTDRVTVQIHHIDATDAGIRTEDVYGLAISVPESLRRQAVLVQPQ